MSILGIIALAIVVGIVLYEFRLRKPDLWILQERQDVYSLRKGRLYPRHFSLALPKKSHSLQQTIEASAKGNIEIKVKLAMTVAADLDHLRELVRMGGWNPQAVSAASKELETVVHSLVREFTERHELEELSSEAIDQHLRQKIGVSRDLMGLLVTTFTVQAFDAVDPKIAEAVRQQESARILEATELLNQKARITAAQAKLKADEEIAQMESDVRMKSFDLKKAALEKEAEIAQTQTDYEVRRHKTRLEIDKEELQLLMSNPELLILTPQAARLAEASQALKNARTIVALSPKDFVQGSEWIEMFRNCLQGGTPGEPKKAGE
jgi:hypothetical protein